MEENKNENKDKLNEYLRKRALGLLPLEKDKKETEQVKAEEKKVETKNEAEEKPEEIKYSRLEKEIKAEEESRKLGKKKKEKTKKTPEEIAKSRRLRSKIISWALGATIFAGSALGIGSCIKNRNSEESKIKREFDKANKTITAVLEDDIKYDLADTNITHLYFKDSQNLVVYYQGRDIYQESRPMNYSYAIYEVLEQYYNNLVEAEGNNDPIEYIQCLNKIFETMTLKEEGELSGYQFVTLESATEENIEKFNNIFSAGIQDENITRHLGFLPYYVDVVDRNFDPETKICSYTYKIAGVSYCETKTENTSLVKESESLVMTQNYDSNKIKSYNREITISTSIELPPEFLFGDKNQYIGGDHGALSLIINKIIKDENHEYTIKNDYFEQTDIFDMYEKIKAGEYTK